jgi:hypothetical protein
MSSSLQQTQGLKFHHKPQESIRTHIEFLLVSVRGRKDPVTGDAQVSRLMWHMVAAVLSLRGRLDSEAIASMSSGGIFRFGNTVIQVTHSPDWPLMHVCFAESDRGLRPLIISTRAGAAQAVALAQEVGMVRKVEVLEITQFIVANMLEWTSFDGSQRRHTFEELVTRYNSIIDSCETDPSLKIEVA